MFETCYKPDLSETRRYLDAFWAHEVIDRPCMCVTAPKRGVEPKPFWVSPSMKYFACVCDEWKELLPKIRDSFETTWFGGEAVPQLDVTLGPDTYAAFLGGQIEGRRDSETTWSHPVLDTLEDIRIELDRSPDGAFELFRRNFRMLADWSKGKCLLNQLDYHSHFDALCALRDPAETCMDLLDDPETVTRCLNEIADTYVPIYEALYADGDMENRGTICWDPIWLPKGRTAIVCCDYSCLLSEQQGRKFVLPYVEQEIAYLDRSVYHLDGKDALVHLDNLLAIDRLDCIQWVPGDGAPRTVEWMELLKKIQKAGKSVWLYDWTPDEIRAHFRELDPARVVFSVSCETQDEAERLLEDVRL